MEKELLLKILEEQQKTNELLQAIVSSKEQLMTNSIQIFTGLSFNKKPVSLTEYIKNYEDYVRRCSN